jgi:hypothetical protein
MELLILQYIRMYLLSEIGVQLDMCIYLVRVNGIFDTAKCTDCQQLLYNWICVFAYSE